MEELVFEYGNLANWIKVYSNDGGYAIESFMHDREPQTIKTHYKNSEKYNESTKWDVAKLLIHGGDERDGLIIPLESLN